MSTRDMQGSTRRQPAKRQKEPKMLPTSRLRVVSPVSMVLWALLSGPTLAAADTLLIGAIFPSALSPEEGALKFAVDSLNNDSSILPNHPIAYIGNYTGEYAAFDSIIKVCYQMQAKVSTIIGPMTSGTVKASHPMNLGFHVPMISPTATDPMLQNPDAYRYLLRLSPPDSLQSRALADFIKYFRWDTMAILTDDTDYGINGLIDFQTLAAENKWRVLSVQQFVATSNVSLVDAREQLVTIKGTGARIIVFNCLAAHAAQVLLQAEREGMLTAGWFWIMTDGVTGYSVMPEMVSTHPEMVGLFGLRPVTSNGSLYQDFSSRWLAADPHTYYGAGGASPAMQKPENIVLDDMSWPLMFYDAVLVYAHALHQMLEVDGVSLQPESHDCTQIPAQPWPRGDLVYDYLSKVEAGGVTRRLEFDANGGPKPEVVVYDVVTLTRNGWEIVGHWSQVAGVEGNISGQHSLGGRPLPDVRDYVGDLLNKTLRVVTVVDKPFVFKRGPVDKGGDGTSCLGNDCFYGYAIDLLEKLASELEFRFTIYEAKDGHYGSSDPISGGWDGMMADLIPDSSGETRADLAIGAFTITSKRQQAVSFTKPFRDLQMGILLGSRDQEQYDPWSFLIPLSYELWGLTIGTAFVVALVITVLDKLSPYGHYGQKAQIDNDMEHEAMDKNDDGTVDYWEQKEWFNEKNTLSVSNALLWSLASLFEQGGERHPKSWSARVVAGAWWVGALIIVQSYTANLAAFLTIKSSGQQVYSVQDLARQSDIKYGTVGNHGVQDFFDTAIRSPYKEMGDQMRKWDSYFDNTTAAANFTELQNGSFAFIYDMPAVEYWRGQSCRLRVVRDGFGNMGYGLGLPYGSVYTEELTIKIYHLRESGFLDFLDDTWISETATCRPTQSTGVIKNKTVKIGMPSLVGVFWIVYSGFALAALLLILEWVVSAFTAIDPSRPDGPKTFCEVLKLRYQLFKRDFAENWFMVKFGRAGVHRREAQLRPLPSDITFRNPADAEHQG